MNTPTAANIHDIQCNKLILFGESEYIIKILKNKYLETNCAFHFDLHEIDAGSSEFSIVLTFCDDQIAQNQHYSMATINVISTIGVLAIY